MNALADFYRTHGTISDPGELAEWIDSVPADLGAIREAAGRMVFHYWANGPIERSGLAPERLDEINLRYADDMLACVRALNPASPTEDRTATERMVGCCRDFTLLFVTMARHHGFAARSRVGFASYLMPGWNIDHVVPEVWRDGEWVLMEPEIGPGYVDETDGTVLDPENLPRDRFLVGPHAWQACRSGALDPETFVVSPDLDVPFLRGWPYLLHNLVLDLAALNKQEMVLWDVWGVIHPDYQLDEPAALRMDALAARLLDPDLGRPEIVELAAGDGLQVPSQFSSWDPTDRRKMSITLR